MFSVLKRGVNTKACDFLMTESGTLIAGKQQQIFIKTIKTFVLHRPIGTSLTNQFVTG